ncbi:MAG: Ig-like domain-containing protein, partial [Deltaproteobacteria bacterium]|nr:Ig-like domain-containing protein [Deltaproteobacteria bacterium]
NPSIAKGTTQEFLATGIFSDNSNQDITNQVTWTSSDTGVATISNAAGTAGTATSGSIGTTTISATLSGKTGSTDLEVTAATLQSITITPVNPSIAKGTTQQFAAMGTYSDSTTQDITTQVTWRSSKRQVASISNASGTEGLATARAEGISIITATLGTESGSTLLTVSAAKLTGLAITPQNPSIAKGTEQQFVATGTYSDNSTQVITTQATWSSSDELIASISNANSTEGLATAVATGNVTIKAILDGKKGLTLLTVSAATLVSVSVTPVNPSIAKGTKLQFVATGTYSDNSMQVITTQVTWSSSQPSVATISNASGSHGLAAGDGQGQTVIAATIQGMSDSTSLKVTAAKLISIAVTPTDKSLHVNDTQQYTARGTYSDSTVQDITTQVTWTSTDTGVATISSASGSEGLATALVIGHTTIAAAMSGVKGSTGLTVSGT